MLLAVPWRGLPVGPTEVARAADGPASLGMILEAFGVGVGTPDLDALTTEWQRPSSPTESVQLATLIRIGERGSLRPLGPAFGSGGDEWTAALARDYLRRGYPVLALVQPALLSDLPRPATAASAEAVLPAAVAQPARYVVLMGLEGEYLLYHDSATPDGAARRVLAADLDRAWAGVNPSRPGAAFGFGTGVVGLLDPSRQASGTPAATAPAATAPAVSAAPRIEVVAQGVDQPSAPSGFHPAVLAFFTLLGAAASYLVARLRL